MLLAKAGILPACVCKRSRGLRYSRVSHILQEVADEISRRNQL